MELYMSLVLLIAGSFATGASLISFWLIMRHQQNWTNPSVQSKIVGIIWMIPIYAIDSFLGLWMPNSADYVNMLRDCYEVSRQPNFNLSDCSSAFFSPPSSLLLSAGLRAVPVFVADAVIPGLRGRRMRIQAGHIPRETAICHAVLSFQLDVRRGGAQGQGLPAVSV